MEAAIDLILQKAAEQGFSFLLIVGICIYLVYRQKKMAEKMEAMEAELKEVNKKLQTAIHTARQGELYLRVITTHLRNKNYEMAEQELGLLQERMKMNNHE